MDRLCLNFGNLLSSCPLDLICKIRFDPINSNFILTTTCPILSTKILYKHTKNKIIHIAKDVVTKASSNMVMSNSTSYSLPNCFNLDHINGFSINFIKPDSPLPHHYFVMLHKDSNWAYHLKYVDVGRSTIFNMTIYLNEAVVKQDTVTINFELGPKDPVLGLENLTRVCFKECINDEFVFIGSKTQYSNSSFLSRETFALFYNRNSCFSYIMLDPHIAGIFSTGLIGCVFILNDQKMLCIRDQNYKYGLCMFEANIYIYHIHSRVLISKITIIDEKGDENTHEWWNTSLAFIGDRLVYVKNNRDLITITWINSEYWRLDDSVNIPQQKENKINIKLIGLHNSLSAMVVINCKTMPDNSHIYHSENVYYF